MDRSDRVGIAVSVGLVAVYLEDKEGIKSSWLSIYIWEQLNKDGSFLRKGVGGGEAVRKFTVL